ncbi:MAG: T9SS type A sorting domain-containing protein [Saprospiraceae bacterium]|nr:T9SS type A sorting domain-containing protein [Saprospiraceae bacterium]
MKQFFAMLVFCCSAMTAIAQTITGSVQHDGIERNYRLYVPANLPQGTPPPLVFNLHGFTSNAQQQELYAGMNAVADTAGFIICYPNSVGSAWNIGVAGGSTADDVGFIAALIDKFHAEHNIDLERVYSCGMSNGGFFSYRLACEMGERIAAIASVTGSMTSAMIDGCTPQRPIPVMAIHGDADPVVDYNGAMGNAAVPDVFSFWANKNGCLQPGNNGNIPDIATNDQCTASFESYYACTDLAEVILITVQNGGHTWPGAFPTVFFGPTCQDFNASREIWVFFSRHRLDLPSATSGPAAETVEVKVFPNPFDDFLSLEQLGGGKARWFRIFDAMGRNTWQGEAISTIDTRLWPKGVYFVAIETETGIAIRKAVKA